MKIKKHHILRVVKLSVVIAALWWVFSKVDGAQVDQLMRQSNPWMLLGAVVSFALAQAISGLRMRYYFKRINIILGRKFSMAIYFVSSFYNFLLPGGIGGDAYKVYVISRLKQLRLHQGARIAISERASGLFVLGIFALLLVFYTHIYEMIPYGFYLLCAAIIILPIGYFLSVRLLLQEQPHTAIGAIGYSFFVQLLNVVCVLFLLHGFDLWSQGIDTILHYVLLFLIATVASVLPISIGGVGLRELVALYVAPWLGVDTETSVAMALMFFLVSMVVSMYGAVLQHKLAAYQEQEGEEQSPPPLERGIN